MYDGSAPRTYPVLSTSCRPNRDYCTTFVALPERDTTAIFFSGYDLRNPPFVAAADTKVCSGPRFAADGVLSAANPGAEAGVAP